MKLRSLLAGLAALAVVAFLAAYIGSPWFAVGDMLSAARAGDVARLERHVDLPAVRASLKGQLDERLDTALSKHKDRGALAQLGALFGAAIVDKAVDAAVTPEMIAQALRTARAPDPRKSALPPPDSGPVGEDDGSVKAPKLKADYSLVALDEFDVVLSPRDEPEQKLRLVLRRRGLFGWLLTDVGLPQG
jgi:hypothetical protein